MTKHEKLIADLITASRGPHDPALEAAVLQASDLIRARRAPLERPPTAQEVAYSDMVLEVRSIFRGVASLIENGTALANKRERR
jgi:hypothetical protein